MKTFIIDQKDLNQAITTCMKAVRPKGSLPAYSMLVFKLHQGTLYVKGVNFSLGIYSKAPLISGDDFMVAINGVEISRLVGSLYGNITFEFDVLLKKMSITAKTGKYTLFAEDPIDYPIQDMKSQVLIGSIHRDILVEAVSTVESFAKEDDLRPVLGHVLLEISPESVASVGANHGGISVYSSGNPAYSPEQVLLSRDAVSALSILAWGDIKVSQTPECYIFSDGANTIAQKKPEYKYPEYEKLLPPTGHGTIVNISKDDLVGSTIRLMGVTSHVSRLLLFNFKSGELEITADDADFGRSGVESIKCDCSVDMQIMINGNMLLNLLKSRKSSTLAMDLIAHNAPIKFTGDDNIVSVLMPFVIA